MKLDARQTLVLGAAIAVFGSASPAFASFHLMQIEQVIGGVGGDTSIQAIQLRMRSAGQNFVSATQIQAWDSAGANPVLIIDIPSDVANGALGSRILIASPNFASTFPGVTPDFIMTNPIPPDYLAAGKLTFEFNGGALTFWSLAWGGAGYTGTNTGTTDNDADGNFNPPFAGALPSATGQALQFPGAATAMSTNNAADYAVTAGNAVFTNNAGASTTVPVELMDFKVE
jgi:hypothetical protein